MNKVLATFEAPNGNLWLLDELGILWEQPTHGDPIFVDVFLLDRVYRILAAKTPKRADKMIRMGIKSSKRAARQEAKQQLAWDRRR